MKSVCISGDKYPNRWQIETFEQAQAIAKQASEDLGKPCIAVDRGRCTSPQFDVVEFLQVGDPVSYAFNGDSYPCGHVISISPTLKVITVGDLALKVRFYRTRENSAYWVKEGGTWSLCAGHVSSYNREF